MSDLPESENMPRRPVYQRYLQRKHQMPLEPPTQAEVSDAIEILCEEAQDELTEEARQILREAGGRIRIGVLKERKHVAGSSEAGRSRMGT